MEVNERIQSLKQFLGVSDDHASVAIIGFPPLEFKAAKLLHFLDAIVAFFPEGCEARFLSLDRKSVV